MTKLITSKFRTHAAAQFLESLNEPANTIYYLAAHRSIPFTNDNTPPEPENSIQGSYYELYDELLFGKHITPSDMKHMIRNVPWTSGTVYDMYDDTVEDLESLNFFVVSPESTNYHVFKCLSNNGGVPSVNPPLFSETAADDEEYVTADGYQWKYMYTVDASTYNKFATNEYIPVVPNANVTSNAISGAISTIVIENPGSQYNSYASGTIKESAVNGNTLLYSLSSDKFAEYDVTVANASIFVEGKVTSIYNGKTSNGVIVAVFTANNTLRISNVNRAFSVGANLVSVTNSSITSLISTSTPLNVALSTDAGFYKNNSFYIRSGTGAGQLRTISEYIVTGDKRQVLLNSPLDVLPDTNSIFEIGPRVIITGDGVNANAICVIDPSANSIAEIEIIRPGSGYTYAEVTILANTGNIAVGTNTYVNTSSARARAIIPPKGGHGADIVNELYATRIGIGASFANSENSTIPVTNDFRKISLIKDPLFANAELTLSTSTAANFTAGEYIVQADTGAKGQITNRSGSTLRLTNISGFFQTGNSTVNVITGNTSAQTAIVTAIDRSFETFDQRQIYSVANTYPGPGSAGFQLDELVIQSGLNQINSDIVKLTINQSAYLYNDGELITQKNGANTTANGIIIARYNNILEVNPNYGTFVTGNSSVNYILGAETAANSSVSDVDNTIQANGIGYIHSLNANSTNSTIIALANVKGVLNVSDDPSGTINTIEGQTNGATTKLIGRDYTLNSLVDGSGEIMYVENFSPITRNSSQTEKIKLIIEF
jgi:hypothetical protein